MTPFFDLKSNVHKQRFLAFEQGGDVVLKYQGRLCVPRMDDLQERITKKLIAPDIPFIRVAERCTVI